MRAVRLTWNWNNVVFWLLSIQQFERYIEARLRAPWSCVDEARIIIALAHTERPLSSLDDDMHVAFDLVLGYLVIICYHTYSACFYVRCDYICDRPLITNIDIDLFMLFSPYTQPVPVFFSALLFFNWNTRELVDSYIYMDQRPSACQLRSYCGIGILYAPTRAVQHALRPYMQCLLLAV